MLRTMEPPPLRGFEALPHSNAARAMTEKRTKPDAHFNAEFWLKPHLAGLVEYFCGDEIPARETHVIGSIALSAMSVKPTHAFKTDQNFKEGRKRVVVRINIRSSERQGYSANRWNQFEVLVEHLFYHMLLCHIDALSEEGVEQNEAIRRFLKRHDIDLEHIEFDSLKKTVIRRRQALEKAVG